MGASGQIPERSRPMATPHWCKPLMATLPLLAVLVLAACTGQAAGTAAPSASPTPNATATSSPVNLYVDSKLGFSLALPPGWQALGEPGLREASGNAALTLVGPDEQSQHELVAMGVQRGSGMAAAFAARGTPPGHIGSHPAFSDDRGPSVARVPCLVRIFLAATDYVVADWCAMNAATHTRDFEALLATYQPQTPGYAPHALQARAPQTCGDTLAQLGYAGATGWGRQLGTPAAAAPDRGWGTLTQGASVCSNEGSPDRYLFQCTELANRYLYEQWALPHIPGTAARYFDYVQDGKRLPGVVRDLPAGSYQLAHDASQGRSAFRPRPGDLLSFQDLRYPP